MYVKNTSKEFPLFLIIKFIIVILTPFFSVFLIHEILCVQISSTPSETLLSSHLSSQQICYPNKKHRACKYPINSQGVKMDTLLAIRLRT